ncbi:hypothetical protein FGO68_gene3839 [Halteria grandinella]|uniref:Fatty acid desaturase domain-containing protein n=1 Tax=Halteria grandinella TaxID=5974 RepID=A0A8J8NQQ3_HALGN|nr:hypothetical protein FGO68_gene3839 [Halteria grandinella]
MGADNPEPAKQSTITIKEQRAPSWSDVAPFYATVVQQVGFLFLIYINNPSWAIWATFVLIPLLDKFMPEDRKNINPANLKSFEKDWRFNIPLLIGFFLNGAGLLYIMIGISRGTYGATLWDFSILLASCSVVFGVNVPCISHELYHRRNKYFKILGVIGHMKFLSGHIPIYHNEQHHKYTGIKGKDPGFPPRGTTAFDIVEFFGYYGIRETYIFEDQKLKKRGVVSLMNRLLANRVVRYRAIEIVYLIALYLTLGWKAVVFQILFAQMSLTILSTTNLFEHYGLERKVLNADKPNEKKLYEPQGRHHSWDAHASSSMVILFNLQRHSDHHLFVYKPYQILDSVENSPSLPFGYSAGFLCAWCPPVWRAVMDPMLDALERGEKLREEEVKKQKRILDLYFSAVWITFTLLQFFVIGFNLPAY